MNLTVYLPDDLGRRAKEAGLKGQYSQLLQQAIEDELMKLENAEKHLRGEMTEVELELVDKDGNEYVGTFEGRRIGSTGELDVYLKDDGAVVVHDLEQSEYVEFDERGDPALEEYFSGVQIGDPEAMALMRELNITPRVAI